MKRIKLNEQKKIMVEMLDYIHKICIENNINYTLVGGSLIGSIRHKGFIPWDDDIDIGLTPGEFEKLINLLKTNKSKYKLLYVDSKNYLYPFAKLVDTSTVLIEKKFLEIDDYGVYIDIFEYNNFPNNKMIGWIHFQKIRLYKILIGRCSLKKNEGNLIKRLVGFLSKKIGMKKLLTKYNKLNHKYNKKGCDYLIINWSAYNFKNEIHKKENFEKYKIVKFENINAMIISNYHEVLETIFGDYMKLPPVEKRVSHHNTDIYWKDTYEK